MSNQTATTVILPVEVVLDQDHQDCVFLEFSYPELFHFHNGYSQFENEEQDICFVCKVNELEITLQCNHSFCSGCIMKNIPSGCPKCNSLIQQITFCNEDTCNEAILYATTNDIPFSS